MKIEKFNKGNLRELRVKMHAALSDVEKECGLSINIGSGTYGPHEVRFKLIVSVLNENGVSKQDFDNFMLWAPSNGFDEDDFGRTFTSHGRQFRIAGWNRRRYRYPIIAISDENIPWFFSPRYVLQALGKSLSKLG